MFYHINSQYSYKNNFLPHFPEGTNWLKAATAAHKLLLLPTNLTQCNIRHVSNILPHLGSCSFAWHHYFLHPQCFHPMLEGFRKQNQEITQKHDHKWLHYTWVYSPKKLCPCHPKSHKEGSEISSSAFKSLLTLVEVCSLDASISKTPYTMVQQV